MKFLDRVALLQAEGIPEAEARKIVKFEYAERLLLRADNWPSAASSMRDVIRVVRMLMKEIK